MFTSFRELRTEVPSEEESGEAFMGGFSGVLDAAPL